MLPKQHRLSGYQIPEIIKSGKRYHGQITTLILMLKKEASSASQFTVIVPQKLSKKSTKRNRTKRLINEAIYKNLTKVKSGFGAVLMAKKILDKEKLQEIQPEIESLLEKAEIFL